MAPVVPILIRYGIPLYIVFKAVVIGVLILKKTENQESLQEKYDREREDNKKE